MVWLPSDAHERLVLLKNHLAQAFRSLQAVEEHLRTALLGPLLWRMARIECELGFLLRNDGKTLEALQCTVLANIARRAALLLNMDERNQEVADQLISARFAGLRLMPREDMLWPMLELCGDILVALTDMKAEDVQAKYHSIFDTCGEDDMAMLLAVSSHHGVVFEKKDENHPRFSLSALGVAWRKDFPFSDPLVIDPSVNYPSAIAIYEQARSV